MDSDQYIKLYEKFISGQCTPEEENLLMEYQDNLKMRDVPPSRLSADERIAKFQIYSRIYSVINGRRVKRLRPVFWWAAAAVLIALSIGTVLFKFKFQQTNEKNNLYSGKENSIKPGTTTATLTLADGTTITLDKAKNGVLATSAGAVIRKLKNGLLAYDYDGSEKTDPNLLNTIRIPRGGQYTVHLPDGTIVWLNSESSLSYPVTFSASRREVILKGEAYFEVAKDRKKPFIVHAGRADINVLGTQFNVSAYTGDNVVKTTLLEGSVRLTNESASAILIPGEQGIAIGTNNSISKRHVNVNRVIAWKNGYFIFKDDSIRDIMKQIGRWYDVDIEYRGDVTDKTFGGIYSKNKDIEELLKGLELTGIVNFKIDGRRVIVMSE